MDTASRTGGGIVSPLLGTGRPKRAKRHKQFIETWTACLRRRQTESKHLQDVSNKFSNTAVFLTKILSLVVNINFVGAFRKEDFVNLRRTNPIAMALALAGQTW
jgi:hypothetical protein